MKTYKRTIKLDVWGKAFTLVIAKNQKHLDEINTKLIGAPAEFAGMWIIKPDGATMVIAKDSTVRTIVHESSHATLSVFESIAMTHCSETDEAYSYTLDSITAKVLEHQKKAKEFYKKKKVTLSSK